jgi:transketolase
MRKTCLDMVYQLARRDKRVVFIGSDLGAGVLDAFKHDFPDRFFMEGVQEQNVIGLAAGLAMEGYIPYVNTIASFLTRRCLEQVTIDLCLHNLPVRLIGNGGGLVYAPLGPTHFAQDDFALMRPLANMAIAAPSDAAQMRVFMEQTLDWSGPVYIRLAKGGDPVTYTEGAPVLFGGSLPLREGNTVMILTTGAMGHRALAAVDLLAEQGIACAVQHFHTVKPLDEATIMKAAKSFSLLVTLEEHVLIGGFGAAVAEVLMDRVAHPLPRLLRLGLPDRFPTHYGSQDALLEHFGLQPPAIAARIAACLAGG